MDKTLKKTIWAIMTVTVMVLTATVIVCAAETQGGATGDDYSDCSQITFTANVPEGYTGRIEIYLDKTYPYPLYYIDGQANNGYTSTGMVPNGEHSVDVYSVEDTDGRYSLAYPGSIDTEKDTALEIIVTDTYAGKITIDEGTVEDLGEGESNIHPAQYDFSRGKPGGTINISIRWSPSVKSAVYSIGDSSLNYYDIVLDREHGFSAEVKLPEGIYKEVTLAKVVLDENAVKPDGSTFIFSHTGEIDNNGYTYDVTDGSNLDSDNLMLLIVTDSHTATDVNNSPLLAAGLSRKLDESLAERDLEIKKEKGIQTELTEANKGVAAWDGEEVVVVDSKPSEGKGYAWIIIVAIAVLMGAAVFVIYRIRKKKEEY